jgi:hypothetical protein
LELEGQWQRETEGETKNKVGKDSPQGQVLSNAATEDRFVE